MLTRLPVVVAWVLVAAVVTGSVRCIAGEAAGRTSKNTPWLEQVLKRFPDADADKDGVLTRQEAQAHRAKQQGQGGQRGGARGPRVAPTHADVSYGPHERNVLDVWLAASDRAAPVFVFFHGGGFRSGDKRGVNRLFLQWCLDSGISFAAVNYRLSKQAVYPAQMHDSARAIQFIRSKAAEWKVDPARVAAHGGSAGSGISLWLAFHDDMADPDSDDPVARQSTRLVCAVAMQMQSTYDPREIKKVVPGRAYADGALKELHGLSRDWDWDTAEIDDALSAKLRDSSPIAHLTKDDPPAFLYHRKAQERDGNIHHANFGRYLKTKMDELGIECVHRMDADYDSPPSAFRDMFEFVAKRFGVQIGEE